MSELLGDRRYRSEMRLRSYPQRFLLQRLLAGGHHAMRRHRKMLFNVP
jgi:hypothetical protein